jgi:tetratricopeptide (TPR) repeat protein
MVTKRISGKIVRNWLVVGCLALFTSAPFATEDANQEINALISQGKYGEALAAIDARQAAGESQPSLELLKGAVLVRSGELDQAMEVFQALAKDHQNDAAIFNNIGVIHAEKGEMDKARGAFETALAISPEYEQALYNLGDVYAELACRTYGKIQNPNSGIIPGFCESSAVTQTANMAASRADYTADPKAMDGAQQAVFDAVQGWKERWASQDIDAYLDSYAANFAQQGLTREAWANKRKQALKRPQWIRIELDNPEVAVTGNQATVRFVQKYTASNYQDVVVKQLTLNQDEGGWKIVRERVL